jgi:hypothetical protein
MTLPWQTSVRMFCSKVYLDYGNLAVELVMGMINEDQLERRWSRCFKKIYRDGESRVRWRFSFGCGIKIRPEGWSNCPALYIKEPKEVARDTGTLNSRMSAGPTPILG